MKQKENDGKKEGNRRRANMGTEWMPLQTAFYAVGYCVAFTNGIFLMLLLPY